MKKVLQISNYMYPHIGGIEQVARDIANALNGQKVLQKIICFNEDASIDDCVCRRKETTYDQVDGIEVIRCGCIAKIASQSISLTYPRELRRVIKQFQPDIILFHYPNPFVAHFLLEDKNKDFQLILYWHLDITKQKLLGKLFHGQSKRLIDRADKIVGATPKHINESAYTPYFGDKKEILPYMIDENNLILTVEEVSLAEKIKAAHKGKVLGFFIGRHVPYKGLSYLIEASKELGDANIHFLIAGSGVLTEKLKEQAKGDPKIEFIGRISDTERRAYLFAADIICFPSITRNEAFGLALAEGMYFGKPAVTFTIPGSGVNYVNLDGVTGIECPNRDSKAYARALKTLIEDEERREQYGKAARKRVLDNFTAASFEKNIKNIIEISQK